MLHHFEDFEEKGNSLVMLKFVLFMSKLLECICEVMSSHGIA